MDGQCGNQIGVLLFRTTTPRYRSLGPRKLSFLLFQTSRIQEIQFNEMSRSNMPITPALKKSRKENEREVESHQVTLLKIPFLPIRRFKIVFFQDNQFSSSLFSDPESMFNSIMNGLETSPDDVVSANTNVYHTINRFVQF